MRGGIFDDNYTIEKGDFTTYLSKANKQLFADKEATLNSLPEKFTSRFYKKLSRK